MWFKHNIKLNIIICKLKKKSRFRKHHLKNIQCDWDQRYSFLPNDVIWAKGEAFSFQIRPLFSDHGPCKRAIRRSQNSVWSFAFGWIAFKMTYFYQFYKFFKWVWYFIEQLLITDILFPAWKLHRFPGIIPEPVVVLVRVDTMFLFH